DPEELLDHGVDHPEVDAVGNMLVHGPRLEPVEVFVQPLVFLGDEHEAARQALVDRRTTVDDRAAEAGGRLNEIKGAFQAGDRAGSLLIGHAPYDRGPLAGRAGHASHCELFIAAELAVLAPGVSPLAPTDGFAASDVDPLPLVVEVGTAVDVLEV